MGHTTPPPGRGAAPDALAPLRAAVLVGGRSRRMGRPKEALRIDGERLLDRTLAALATVACAPPALLGAGQGVDGDAAALLRLADAPGVAGPLAGLLAALRSAPPAAWLVAACDLPLLTAAAGAWLVAQRGAGRLAVLPRIAGRVQPLLAVYEPAALPLLERIAAEGSPSPSRLAGHPGVWSPEPPAALAPAWAGANTPEELARLLAAATPPAGEAPVSRPRR